MAREAPGASGRAGPPRHSAGPPAAPGRTGGAPPRRRRGGWLYGICSTSKRPRPVFIPCELKRDYHAEVWTAVMGQLERFYTHDPDAKGFGVYGVFWYGDRRPRQMPAPPNGQASPPSAKEMEQMLIALLPADMRARIAVIVIDVSGQL